MYRRMFSITRSSEDNVFSHSTYMTSIVQVTQALQEEFALLGRSGGSHNKQKIIILNYK